MDPKRLHNNKNASQLRITAWDTDFIYDKIQT